MKNRKQQFPVLIYLIGLMLIMSWALGAFSGRADDLSYSDIVTLFENEQVKRFVVSENVITLELHTPLDGETELTEHLADPESFRSERMWLSMFSTSGFLQER